MKKRDSNDSGDLPEWAPAGAGPAFVSRVLPGVEDPPREGAGARPLATSAALTPEEYAQGVLAGDRAILGRAITLVESSASAHEELAQEVLRQLLPHTGKAVRVGITGVPGVGKSTFIEALGGRLLGRGHRLAVLAIDPSSAITKGSILGDKTRMDSLGRDPRCFIRPSPAGDTLGGVARKTRETLLVCEAAGYDVVLVETVGVGQSEITVRGLVDFLVLLLLPGAGDELQGIKRGIMEIADVLVVNKADGDNRLRAEVAREEMERALHVLASGRPQGTPPVALCSSTTEEGVEEVWGLVEALRSQAAATGRLEEVRRQQNLGWLRSLVEERLRSRFYAHPAVKALLPRVEAKVEAGTLPPTAAMLALIAAHDGEG